MAKGAYQLGALKAIAQCFSPEEFSVISCSSIGALNGYAFAMHRLHEAEKMWRNLCKTTPRQSIGRVLRSTYLQQQIEHLCYENDTVPVKCFTTLLDISKRKVSYFNLQQAPPEALSQYLKASVSMPIYNRSVRLGNHAYFDGAMVDNIPVYPLLLQPPDYIFCIYFDTYSYTFESNLFDQRIIKITFPAENRLKDSVLFRKEVIEEMLSRGYEETQLMLQSLLSSGKEDLEYIYHYIKVLNQRMPPPKVRITGDVFVTNLNRITKKFAKRNIE